jgi:hypothetical protein
MRDTGYVMRDTACLTSQMSLCVFVLRITKIKFPCRSRYTDNRVRFRLRQYNQNQARIVSIGLQRYLSAWVLHNHLLIAIDLSLVF